MGEKANLLNKALNTARGLVASLAKYLLSRGVPSDNISIDFNRSDDGMIKEAVIEVQLGSGLLFQQSQVIEIRVYDDDNYICLLPSIIAKSFDGRSISFHNIKELQNFIDRIIK